MGPTWVLSAPDGPDVGPMNLAIRDDAGYVIILAYEMALPRIPARNLIDCR